MVNRHYVDPMFPHVLHGGQHVVGVGEKLGGAVQFVGQRVMGGRTGLGILIDASRQQAAAFVWEGCQRVGNHLIKDGSRDS
jgi:hypothetical protein